jgi:hypothetical protein
VTFPSTLQFLILFCTGFEVLKVVRIYNAVWVRTLYSLVLVYECSGEALWVCLHRPSNDGHRMSWPNPSYTPVWLCNTLSWKTIVLKIIFCLFSCIVSLPYLLQTNWLHVLSNKYTLLFYIMFIFYYDLSRNMLKKIFR